MGIHIIKDVAMSMLLNDLKFIKQDWSRAAKASLFVKRYLSEHQCSATLIGLFRSGDRFQDVSMSAQWKDMKIVEL